MTCGVPSVGAIDKGTVGSQVGTGVTTRGGDVEIRTGDVAGKPVG